MSAPRRPAGPTLLRPAGPTLLQRAGPPAADGAIVRINPSDAGWRYLSLAAHRMVEGQALHRPADDDEVVVIVLEGSAAVRAGEREFPDMGTRGSVFDGPPPPIVLVEPGLPIDVTGRAGALVVVGSAPGGATRLSRLIGAADVLVESRGSGTTQGASITCCRPPRRPDD